MALLKIIKLSSKTWKHNSDVDGDFILTKFYAKQEDNNFILVESYGAKRRKYLINEIEVYDIGGGAETFANFSNLFLRLEELEYTGFYEDGMFVFNPSSYVSADVDNSLIIGTDGKFFTPTSEQVKRISVCDLGKFRIQVGSINNYVRHSAAGVYFAPGASTGVSNHLLLVPSAYSVIYKVPFDCSLEEITLSMSSGSDGSFSIWKTAPNTYDTTPIEIYHVDDSSNTQFKQFVINSSLILKDSFIHIWFARSGGTSGWTSAGFLKFIEL